MQKPQPCLTCPLNKFSHGFSEPEGRGNIGVTLVGEALGNNERAEGLPFRPKGASGSLLERAFGDLGYTRQQFNITNILQCEPFYELDRESNFVFNAINHCVGAHTKERIERYDHQVIVALGTIPFTTMTDYSGSDSEKASLSYLRGYALPYRLLGGKESSKLVVPTYHPSFIIRGNWEYYEYLKRDLRYAVDLAKGKCKDPREIVKTFEYHCDFGIDDFTSYYYLLKDNPRLLVSYDIETPTLGGVDENKRDEIIKQGQMEVIQIQFSHKKKFGIAVHCKEEYRKIAKKILELPNPKANHNAWNFDNKILLAQDWKINGVVHDTMWMFKHWYPGLELHLQSVAGISGYRVPWKHLFGEQLDWYGCADVDAVQYIMRDLPAKMKAMGVWQGYDRHVRQVYELVFTKGLGVPVDTDKLLELKLTLQEQLAKLITRSQKLFPLELKNIKQKQGLKRTPKGVEELERLYDENYLEWKADAERNGKRLLEKSEFILKKTGYIKRVFTFLDDNGEQTTVERWGTLVDFKPSSHQVKKYVSWKQAQCKTKKDKAKWNLPKNLKTKKETTGKDAIDVLVERTGDELLTTVKEIRSLGKMITNDLKWWNPVKVGERSISELEREVDEKINKMLECKENDEVPF